MDDESLIVSQEAEKSVELQVISGKRLEKISKWFSPGRSKCGSTFIWLETICSDLAVK